MAQQDLDEIDQSKLVEFPDSYLYDGKIVMAPILFPKEIVDEAHEMEVYPDDTILIGYPKTGTTWMTEVIWIINNDLDFDGSKSKCVWDRIPEVECIRATDANEGASAVSIMKQMARPRCFKTHMPFWFWDKEFKAKKPKIIYIMRNPKDMLVSYYHMVAAIYPDVIKEFDNVFAMFQAKRLVIGDYFENILSYWKYRDEPNFLFLKYEDLKADANKEFKKVASFMGKSLSDEDIQRLVDATTFNAMKKNPGTNMSNVKWLDQSTNKFQRKGIVGDWKNYFTEKMSQYLDKRYKEELVPQGIEFQFSQ